MATLDYTGTDPTGGVLLTGPVSGTVRLSDGTVYDVTPAAIVHGPGHAGPLCHHIAKMHEAAGGIPVGAGPRQPFTHVCDEACGAEAVTPTAAPAA